MTRIDVISGFLGAGKTTFIKKLLGGALKGEQVVLIENEFGDIAIDGGFLKDAGIQITEMSQGCICCTLVGDFEKALVEVIEKYAPDRIIIEPSGVGKLSDVMKAVTNASASLDVQLNSAVTLVDAKKCKMYMKNFGEFFNNQVQYAGTIVLSRTDIADPVMVEADVEMIRSINKDAEIITTPIDQLSSEKLLAVMEKKEDDMLAAMIAEALEVPDGDEPEEEEHQYKIDFASAGEEEEHEHEHHHHDDDEDVHEHEHHHHEHEEGEEHEHHHHHHHHHGEGHDADEIFESWGGENIPAITYEKLEGILKSLDDAEKFGIVVRAKGMLKAADKDTWYYFDFVPEEFEIREGDPEYTGKACVIGSELKLAELNKLFR